MKKKFAILTAILLSLSFTLTACTSSKDEKDGGSTPTSSSTPTEEDNKKENTNASDKEKTIVLRTAGYPMSLTPDFQADDYGWVIHQNVFNRLCKLDASKSEPIPDLAESWEYSEDVKTLTFYLKENAKWHDGVPVTSKDVKYTFDTIKENPTYYFSTQLNIVDSIDTPDDYTVVFNLNTPDAAFASLLGWYGTFVLPEHVYNNGTSWADNPVGTANVIGSGPFKYESHKDSESVTLVRNNDYHDGAPKLDKLIFSVISDNDTAYQAFLNGEIDALTSVPYINAKELEKRDDMVVDINAFPSPVRLIFNMDDELISDLNVRKAIATALDRDEISQKAFFGYYEPEYNYYPSLISWATNNDDTAPKHNTEDAIKILEDAGYTKDANGYYISFEFDYFDSLNGGPDTAKLLQAQLKEAGIEMKLISSEYQAWSQKVESQNFSVGLMGGFMGPDPSALKARFGTGSVTNYGNYSNEAFDELLALGGSTADIEKRAEYYYEAQKIMAEDIGYLPLVAYAAPEAYWANITNMPIDGTGKWGWDEYTYTDILD